MRKLSLTAIALSMLPALAQAHPGHDTGASFMAGALHPLLGADHLLALVATGLLAWRMAGRARAAIVVAFPVLLGLGATMGLAGVELMHTEVMIVLSVVALSLLALKPPRRLPVATVMLTALFAVFHGQAHGLEAAGGIAPGGFVAGLALSSALVICGALFFAQLSGRAIACSPGKR